MKTSIKYAWAAAAGLGLGLVIVFGSGGRLGIAVCLICSACTMAFIALLELPIRLGERRHTRFVDQWPVDLLKHAGFRIERIGDYRGLKGTRGGYVVRVYHDPDGLTQFGNLGEDLCVMVYYTPPRRRDGNWDMVRIRKLQDDLPRYKRITLDPFLVEYGLRYLCGRTPAGWGPRWGEVLWEIDRVVDLVKSHGLEPLDEAAVDHAVEKDPWNNGPSTETFQRHYGPAASLTSA